MAVLAEGADIPLSGSIGGAMPVIFSRMAWRSTAASQRISPAPSGKMTAVLEILLSERVNVFADAIQDLLHEGVKLLVRRRTCGGSVLHFCSIWTN